MATTLRQVAAELRSMDQVRVTRIIRGHLERRARPVGMAVRARILAIPTKGPKHTGLRQRIADCVDTFLDINGPIVTVGVEIIPERMPTGQWGLPLYMEGVNRHGPWRHPVFGNFDRWVSQDAHPYFYDPASQLALAGREGIDAAADEIARDIS